MTKTPWIFVLLIWPWVANGAEPTHPLNDTGVTGCVKVLGEALTECDSDSTGDRSDFPGQDGRYGRDAAAEMGVLQKIGGGIKGFDLTKLDKTGEPLIDQGKSWSRDAELYDNGSEDNGTRWSCVKDNVTGLIWEIIPHAKPCSGSGVICVAPLRDVAYRYLWPGTYSYYPTGCGTNSPDQCTTTIHVSYVNSIGLCGRRTGWRLPTLVELISMRNIMWDWDAQSYFPDFYGLKTSGASFNSLWSQDTASGSGDEEIYEYGVGYRVVLGVYNDPWYKPYSSLAVLNQPAQIRLVNDH